MGVPQLEDWTPTTQDSAHALKTHLLVRFTTGGIFLNAAVKAMAAATFAFILLCDLPPNPSLKKGLSRNAPHPAKGFPAQVRRQAAAFRERLPSARKSDMDPKRKEFDFGRIKAFPKCEVVLKSEVAAPQLRWKAGFDMPLSC